MRVREEEGSSLALYRLAALRCASSLLLLLAAYDASLLPREQRLQLLEQLHQMLSLALARCRQGLGLDLGGTVGGTVRGGGLCVSGCGEEVGERGRW
jgi:hypothetical protein